MPKNCCSLSCALPLRLPTKKEYDQLMETWKLGIENLSLSPSLIGDIQIRREFSLSNENSRLLDNFEKEIDFLIDCTDSIDSASSIPFLEYPQESDDQIIEEYENEDISLIPTSSSKKVVQLQLHRPALKIELTPFSQERFDIHVKDYCLSFLFMREKHGPSPKEKRGNRRITLLVHL